MSVVPTSCRLPSFYGVVPSWGRRSWSFVDRRELTGFPLSSGPSPESDWTGGPGRGYTTSHREMDRPTRSHTHTMYMQTVSHPGEKRVWSPKSLGYRDEVGDYLGLGSYVTPARRYWDPRCDEEYRRAPL